ncbi:MAG: hypothetical protein V3S73_06705, partial [Gammaproteobacteria bacterium]
MQFRQPRGFHSDTLIDNKLADPAKRESSGPKTVKVGEPTVTLLMQAQMDVGVPVLSAVLSPHHFHETDEHRRFFLGH